MSNHDELQSDDLPDTDPVDHGEDLSSPDDQLDDTVDQPDDTELLAEAVDISEPDEGAGTVDDESAAGTMGSTEAASGTAPGDNPVPPADKPTPEPTSSPEPTPKIGVILAGLTLLVGLVGLVYYILAPGAEPAYTVNGEETSNTEMVAQLDEVSTDSFADVVDAPEEATPERRAALAQLLSGLIVEDLLMEEASGLGVEVAQSDIDAELDLILTDGFDGDQAAFDDAIANSGLTSDGVQQQLRTTLLVEVLAEAESGPVEVSEEDIQSVYDAQFSSGNVSHILVETEEEAQSVIDRLNAGEDFAALAAELSIDTGSGQAGGDLGPFQAGAFVPEFEEAVLETAPGEITGPVETQFGFHVITVGEAPALDEVRDQIEEGLRGQGLNGGIQALLTRLDGETEVTVNPAFGEWVGLLEGGVLPPQENLVEPTSAPVPTEE